MLCCSSKYLLRCLGLILQILFLPSLLLANEGADCAIATTAIEVASKLRNLPVLRNVPCKLQNRETVGQYIRETVLRKIPPEKIRNEGKVYKLLGLIPQDYDYFEGLISLYTEELGGYYDPEREFYAMASWMPGIMQWPIAIHELTHALQDQHYQLEKLIDHRTLDSDALIARAALIEGDATAVMLDYSRSLGGKPSIANEESITGLMLQNISGAMLSGSLKKAPRSVQSMLIFPYVSGLNFAHHLLKKNGYQEIDRAFARLPESTEQILHPQLYLSGKRGFVDIDVPTPSANVPLASEEAVFTDRLGEFIISVLLSNWLMPEKASAAAAGWGGDRIALYDLKSSTKGLLIWQILWDTEPDAREFFSALVEAYSKRFSSEPTIEQEKARFVVDDLGVVEIKLQAMQVLLQIGGA